MNSVAKIFGFDFVLVVLGVHEHIQRIGEIRVSGFLAIKQDHFELIVGAVHRFLTSVGQQVFHFHLDHRSIAARLGKFGFDNHHGLARDHDNITDTDFLCGFHNKQA